MRRLLLLLSLLASIATSPAEEARPVAPAPPVAAVAEDTPERVGHCSPGEVLFQCPVGDRELAVCGGATPAPWIQYHYGPPGAPDLRFPADREGSVALFAHQERHHVRSMGDALVFENEGWRYEVLEMIGGGGIPDEAELNNFRGVMVFHGDELVSTLACSEEPTSDWSGLAALL